MRECALTTFVQSTMCLDVLSGTQFRCLAPGDGAEVAHLLKDHRLLLEGLERALTRAGRPSPQPVIHGRREMEEPWSARHGALRRVQPLPGTGVSPALRFRTSGHPDVTGAQRHDLRTGHCLSLQQAHDQGQRQLGEASSARISSGAGYPGSGMERTSGPLGPAASGGGSAPRHRLPRAVQEVSDSEPLGSEIQVLLIDPGRGEQDAEHIPPLAVGDLRSETVPLQLRQEGVLGGGDPEGPVADHGTTSAGKAAGLKVALLGDPQVDLESGVEVDEVGAGLPLHCLGQRLSADVEALLHGRGERLHVRGLEPDDHIRVLRVARLPVRRAGSGGGAECRSCRSRLRGLPCLALEAKVHTRGVPPLCGPPQFHDDRRDVLTNPRVLVEVLSPSTEEFDRGKKRILYQTIESLTDYVLIAQDAPQVEHWVRRADDQWLVSTVQGPDARLALESIGCALDLSEIYDRVSLAVDS